MPSTATNTNILTDLLTHLVRFPTVSDDSSTNRAALDWVEEQLSSLPLKIQRLENHGTPALIATTPAARNPKSPKLWLLAHMDVVGGEPSDFVASVRNGRLHGRGTHDMKFAIACFIALLQELGSNLKHYDLGLMITTDEEIGGTHGARWLVQDLGYRGEAVFVPDSSTPWKMEVSAKGIARLELTATGQAAHASRPWQGVNAIDELMRFADHLRTFVPAEPCGDPHHYHSTINLSMISGGVAVNQVPGTAKAQVDIRFTPKTSIDDINSWIIESQAAVPSVSASVINTSAPCQIPANAAGELYKALALEVADVEVTDHHAHGGSDARWFAWKGIPIVNVGVTGSGYHTSPEWVDLADLARYYEVFRRFVNDWTRVE
ncbi:MAG TPA: M20 family metallopeptidase [Candidatus Saccharimonadia bacterium]|jgi:succinyl-diaminopimelate desuccinylase